MSVLTLAIRNTLVQDSDLTALLGRSVNWGSWIFDETPRGVTIENSQRCLIVVSPDTDWAQPNEHNTMKFPRVFVDVWADPTRNDDNSMRRDDAQTKIDAVVAQVNKTLHTVNLSRPGGGALIWGTAAQIADKTGVVIGGSAHLTGPYYAPIRDGNGGQMGRCAYGVNVLS